MIIRALVIFCVFFVNFFTINLSYAGIFEDAKAQQAAKAEGKKIPKPDVIALNRLYLGLSFGKIDYSLKSPDTKAFLRQNLNLFTSLGWDYIKNHLYTGFDAEFGRSVSTTKSQFYGDSIKFSNQFIGIARGKIGYAFSPKAAFYLTGGLAYSQLEYRKKSQNFNNTRLYSGTIFNPLFGLGASAKITQNTALFLEYLATLKMKSSIKTGYDGQANYSFDVLRLGCKFYL
jgi:opacity protein-like surface antigen